MKYKEKHQIVLDNCDGYSYVTDEETQADYQKFYHWVKKDDKVMFPFIYKVNYSVNGFVEKCILYIPKKRTIVIQNGIKTIRLS